MGLVVCGIGEGGVIMRSVWFDLGGGGIDRPAGRAEV